MPVRKLGDNVKSRLRLFMPLFLFARRFVASGLLTVWILGNAGLGQPVTVQIVNGRNGKPIHRTPPWQASNGLPQFRTADACSSTCLRDASVAAAPRTARTRIAS